MHASRLVALLHRRLAIIGTSNIGAQPMLSEDGSLCISFNGEIYNYLELADEIGLPRESPVRNSDTAVLVHAMMRWGVNNTLKKCIGMFALAVWDERTRELFLARDPAGKKPLYYGIIDGCLYFASELNAFRSVNEFNLSVDEQQLSHYLSFGFVPSPATIFREVRSVPPATTMTWRSDLRFSIASNHIFPSGGCRRISQIQAMDEAENLLSESVKLRLRADVPLGCFLSGGIDSGLLTAFASKQLAQPLRTFTVSVRGSSSDESALARETSQRYGTIHEEVVVDPSIETTLPKVVSLYGQPFADPSAVPAFVVAQAARKFVTVALSGEGADEIFCGYRRHNAFRWASQMRVLGRFLPSRLIESAVARLPVPRVYRGRYAFVHRFLRGVAAPLPQVYFAYCMDGFSGEEKDLLFARHTDSDSLSLLQQRLEEFSGLDELEQMLALDFFFNLHDDMLVKADISSMAHSLELRCPFLDVRLIDWAQTLSPEVRCGLLRTKPLLRLLAKRHLPACVAGAPKRGFEIPIHHWLRNELFEMARSAILDPKGLVASRFSVQTLINLFEFPDRLDPDRWARRVWNLFVLAVWHKRTPAAQAAYSSFITRETTCSSEKRLSASVRENLP